MCWRTVWFLPGPAAPPLRADCADDGYDYEELPVSLPPHVPRGLSRFGDDDAASAGGGEATTFAVEQLVAPPAPNAGGFGIGGGAWLALVCASSISAKMAGLSQS